MFLDSLLSATVLHRAGILPSFIFNILCNYGDLSLLDIHKAVKANKEEFNRYSKEMPVKHHNLTNTSFCVISDANTREAVQILIHFRFISFTTVDNFTLYFPEISNVAIAVCLPLLLQSVRERYGLSIFFICVVIHCNSQSNIQKLLETLFRLTASSHRSMLDTLISEFCSANTHTALEKAIAHMHSLGVINEVSTESSTIYSLNYRFLLMLFRNSLVQHHIYSAYGDHTELSRLFEALLCPSHSAGSNHINAGSHSPVLNCLSHPVTEANVISNSDKSNFVDYNNLADYLLGPESGCLLLGLSRSDAESLGGLLDAANPAQVAEFRQRTLHKQLESVARFAYSVNLATVVTKEQVEVCQRVVYARFGPEGNRVVALLLSHVLDDTDTAERAHWLFYSEPQIADECLVSRTDLSPLLYRLQQEHWIRMAPHPEDGNSVVWECRLEQIIQTSLEILSRILINFQGEIVKLSKAVNRQGEVQSNIGDIDDCICTPPSDVFTQNISDILNSTENANEPQIKALQASYYACLYSFTTLYFF